MQGLVLPPQGLTIDSSDENDDGGLQRNRSINWVTRGKVGPVKNQGTCGACWAFAATTIQESMQAIKNDTDVVQLSEQEGIDCDASSSGCDGGTIDNYWKMSARIGSQAAQTYQYEAKNGTCRNQTDKRIASKAIERSVKFHKGTSRMKKALQKGPMSAAVAAGNDCWRYYESGILSKENNCPTKIDHNVVIVGYEESGDKPYWIIQNSWGEKWGQNGFIHIAVEKGKGTSSINT